MRRTLISVLGVALVSALCFIVQPSATAALPTHRQWLDDVNEALVGSNTYLDQRKRNGGGKMAVVFDIDNTSIQTHYAWPKPVWRTRNVARHAHDLGMKVFFVTGRSGAASINNGRNALAKAGYPIDGVYGRRAGEGLLHSKIRNRRAITERGYDIVANVGNRWTDVYGCCFDRKYKLPGYNQQLS